MIDVLKNASEALIFINTERGYVKTCKCDTIKWQTCPHLNIWHIYTTKSMVERFQFLFVLMLIEGKPAWCILLHDPKKGVVFSVSENR